MSATRLVAGTDAYGPILAPDDGQQVTAVSNGLNDGPVAPAVQALADHDERVLSTLTHAHLQQRPYLRSVDKTHILVGPLVILFADGSKFATVAETSIANTMPQGGHLYAWNNGGVLTIFDEDVGPDIYESTQLVPLAPGSQTKYRYLGSYPNSGADVLPFFTSTKGRCCFAGKASPFGIANITAATFSTFDLTAYLVPAHARLVTLEIDMESDGSASMQVLLRPDGVDPTPGTDRVVRIPAGANPTRGTAEITLPVVNGKIQARLDAAAAGFFAAIYVTGWE